MARKILLITTDQQRFDALGCNGGTIARTPNIDALAAQGLNYVQARNQNVACMPARATILTGQYTGMHGVVSNGIALPAEATGIAGLAVPGAMQGRPLPVRASETRERSLTEWEDSFDGHAITLRTIYRIRNPHE